MSREVIQHRFLIDTSKDIYSEQTVKAEVQECYNFLIAVAKTDTLFHFRFRDNKKFAYVAFEYNSGFPFAHGESPEHALAKTKTAIRLAERNNVDVDTVVLDALDYYGYANKESWEIL